MPLYRIGAERTILIVGLGNIGAEYENTRHNIGFSCVDDFAQKHDFGWVSKKDLFCQLASGQVGQTRVILIKPTTFMNDSGKAASAVQRFYRVYNQDTYVIHDELDIELGSIRTKIGGGSAGHNGIKSLIQQVGEDFGRIRVGIGPKSPTQIDSADFVLAKFKVAEMTKLKQAVQEVQVIIKSIVTGNGNFASETRKI